MGNRLNGGTGGNGSGVGVWGEGLRRGGRGDLEADWEAEQNREGRIVS